MWRISLDGTQEMKLVESSEKGLPVLYAVTDDAIYFAYSDSPELYVMNIDNKAIEEFYHDKSGVEFYDGWLALTDEGRYYNTSTGTYFAENSDK